MDSLPLRKEDLPRYQNDRDIVRKTALQVIKDFNTFGFEIDFPDDLLQAYDSLFDQLAPVIKSLLSTQAAKLYALLYTIDLSEAAIQQGLNEMEGSEIHDSITHLILERELKKVLTKEFFSRKS